METWTNYYSNLYPNTSAEKLEKTFIKEVKKRMKSLEKKEKMKIKKYIKVGVFTYSHR